MMIDVYFCHNMYASTHTHLKSDQSNFLDTVASMLINFNAIMQQQSFMWCMKHAMEFFSSFYHKTILKLWIK